jgi:penicillin amidase
LAALCVLSITSGCSWALSFFHPPALKADVPVVHKVDAKSPAGKVEILFDDMGVPHIYGDEPADLAYGLGFAHARDRLFQVVLLRHAAQGRLTELFGEDLLEVDRQLRFLSWGLDEQIAHASPFERGLAEAYVAGVNEGAEHAGRSLEMQILGVNFAPMEAREVLAIARLQEWELSVDMDAELARARILARLPEGDARREALLVDVATGGVPIVSRDAASGAPLAPALGDEPPSPIPLPGAPPPGAPPVAPEEEPPGDDVDPPLDTPDRGDTPSAVEVAPEPAPAEAPPSPPADDATDATGAGGPNVPPGLEWLADLARGGMGASNSWVVHGSRTESGHPVLSNDPHLAHRAPSVFYLAHLEHPDFTVVGPTFPGLPGVLIGHTRHLAWGMTTSFADTQDLVRIRVSPTRSSHYVVDAEEQPFETRTERFSAGGKVIHTEVFRATRFGPVLPDGYKPQMEPGETFALLWPGFDPEVGGERLTAFWDLARAKDVAEASAAVEKMTAGSQNVSLAFRDGSIAYRLGGKIPVRRSGEPTWAPRDGSSSAAGWSGYLPAEDKPQLTNPAAGFFVTANQRVVEEDGPSYREVGGYGVPPHRARRIHERLDELFAKKPKASASELLAIQQDVLSVEARDLAPILGKHCPEMVPGQPAARVAEMCARVRAFDGRYATDSEGALAFTALLEALQEEVLAVHLGEDVARQLKRHYGAISAIEDALIAEDAGTNSPLLDDRRTKDREGIAGFVSRAAEPALVRMVGLAGAAPAGWRWGAVHTLSFRSPLAQAPLVGGIFATPAKEQAGWHRAIRAEGGLPVRHGSVLRFVAEMSDPIAARMTIDLGNSGHVGSVHYADHAPSWDAGQPRKVPTERAEVEARTKGRLVLERDE